MVARFATPLVLSRRRLSVPNGNADPGPRFVDIIRVSGQALVWLRPGDDCFGEFQIRNPTTGALIAPDNNNDPAIEILRNNVLDAAILVSVTPASIGRYRYQFTVPQNYVAGDFVTGIASATVDQQLDVATVINTRLIDMNWTGP